MWLWYSLFYWLTAINFPSVCVCVSQRTLNTCHAKFFFSEQLRRGMLTCGEGGGDLRQRVINPLARSLALTFPRHGARSFSLANSAWSACSFSFARCLRHDFSRLLYTAEKGNTRESGVWHLINSFTPLRQEGLGNVFRNGILQRVACKRLLFETAFQNTQCFVQILQENSFFPFTFLYTLSRPPSCHVNTLNLN